MENYKFVENYKTPISWWKSETGSIGWWWLPFIFGIIWFMVSSFVSGIWDSINEYFFEKTIKKTIKKDDIIFHKIFPIIFIILTIISCLIQTNLLRGWS